MLLAWSAQYDSYVTYQRISSNSSDTVSLVTNDTDLYRAPYSFMSPLRHTAGSMINTRPWYPYNANDTYVSEMDPAV